MSVLADKKLIVFDLDGTLAPSKFPMEPEMGALLARLLEKAKVAVISGSGYAVFQTNLLNRMPAAGSAAGGLGNLYLLPVSGTRLYAWKGAWCEEYAEHMTPKEKESVMGALDSALRAAGYQKPEHPYGDIIEDRGSQITFSGLGQSAPLALKSAWDPSRVKREKIAAVLKEAIPSFDVRIGGISSIDITKRGVNKAYGIRKLEEYLHVRPDDILFVGDALFVGGNDYPARATGVDCIQVKGPAETGELIKGWLGAA